MSREWGDKMQVSMDQDLMDLVEGKVQGKSLSFDRALMIQVLRELKKKEPPPPPPPSDGVPSWITLVPHD